MKNRCCVTAIIGMFCLLSASTFGQGQPPAVIDQLGPDESLKYLTKVSEIPKSVVEVMTNTMHMGQLKMADKGGKWNVTDVITDPDLPFHRLIWAVETQKYFVIHYERGGIGHSTRFLVISPPDADGKRKLEWAAVDLGAKAHKNLKEFLSAAKSGKLKADGSLLH
jgi:hypothetical protein